MIRYVLPFAVVSALAAPAGAEVQLTSTGPVVELTVHESVEAEPDLVTVGAGRGGQRGNGERQDVSDHRVFSLWMAHGCGRAACARLNRRAARH